MDATPMNEQVTDFFISYTFADRAWAAWIAWQLNNAGYTVTLQAWDFVPGRDFLHEMEKATSRALRTIAVLSDSYSNSVFGESEWRAAFAKDPTGEKGLLIPVKVRSCTPPSLLASRVYIDLTDKEAEEAKAALLVGVSGKGMRPAVEPDFPGRVARPPMFPGDSGQRHEPLQRRSDGIFEFPRGRTAVYFPRGLVRGAAVATDRYSTLRELLDDLYVNYLSDQFPPFSYGKHWLLRGENRVIAPLVWLSEVSQPVHEIAKGWLDASPFEAGIRIDRGFTACHPADHRYFGVIAGDARVFDVIEEREKALSLIRYSPGRILPLDESLRLSRPGAVFAYASDEISGRVVDLREDREFLDFFLG